MPAQWLNNSNAVSGRAGTALSGVLNTLSQPANARRLRLALLCLLAVWGVLALTRLLWALVPSAAPGVAASAKIINPLSTGQASTVAAQVDIDRLMGWHLFGEAGAVTPPVAIPEASAKASALAGIEDGAQQTRLQLKLRGIVSSTDEGLGHAIIENQNLQAVYAVGDKLPAAGQVKLAKVMPQQVVLDNGGTYELLVLFEESSIGSAAVTATPAPAAAPPASEQIDMRGDAQATTLAQSYREQLYQNPQSLIDVVSISAVREGTALVGYRVSPGKDQEQFNQLGFKPGDVVTAVNGVSLDNPANTMVLYNTMRDAGEAVFELQREGQPLSLSVNLDSGATQ